MCKNSLLHWIDLCARSESGTGLVGDARRVPAAMSPDIKMPSTQPLLDRKVTGKEAVVHADLRLKVCCTCCVLFSLDVLGDIESIVFVVAFASGRPQLLRLCGKPRPFHRMPLSWWASMTTLH